MLEVSELKDEWTRLCPAEWQQRPFALGADLYQFDKPTGEPDCYERGVAKIRQVLHKCASEQPSDEEMLALFDKVRQIGEPVAFYKGLVLVKVPEFSEGHDPTVKEFFEGSFDPSTLSYKAVLMTYPFFEVTQ